ncbi:hypothetical protein BpHYR1_017582 [Brachionus plicatilis]|uniref:WAP domain-containing protein n=1 Tax=Brachionus plicatilis TaxID=10195 RepID=A0A3M7QGC1_BRAPC|nr:hypothetical protein BpHYR1_017582 [Brachionus plicatilis]
MHYLRKLEENLAPQLNINQYLCVSTAFASSSECPKSEFTVANVFKFFKNLLVKKCRTNSDCKNGQICISNGCGHSCSKTTNI